VRELIIVLQVFGAERHWAVSADQTNRHDAQ